MLIGNRVSRQQIPKLLEGTILFEEVFRRIPRPGR
jgi:hypothetical protein